MVNVISKRVLPWLLDSNDVGARNIRIAKELRDHASFDRLTLYWYILRSLLAIAVSLP